MTDGDDPRAGPDLPDGGTREQVGHGRDDGDSDNHGVDGHDGRLAGDRRPARGQGPSVPDETQPLASTDGSATTGEGTEPPRSLVEAYLTREGAVLGLLEDCRRDQLEGNARAVRERLRSFAEASPDAFFAVTLSVTGGTSFFADLHAQYEHEPPVDRLHDLQAAAAPLERELDLVYMERVRGVFNPGPRIDPSFRYSAANALPTLAYEIRSGAVPLCRFEHQPSHALALAASLVAAVARLLEHNAAAGNEIQPAERRMLGQAADLFVEADDDLQSALDPVVEAADRSDGAADVDPLDARVDDWDDVGRTYH
jgi:hypothetical protein